jgi:hypothetical protein
LFKSRHYMRRSDLMTYSFKFLILIFKQNTKTRSNQYALELEETVFSDKVDLITNSIHNLRERTCVNALIERIYQQIEEDMY